MKEFKFALLSEKARAPERGEGNVGYDVFAYGDHILNIGETRIIPLGFYAVLEEGYGAFAWDRGSFGARGLHIFRQLITNEDGSIDLNSSIEIVPFAGVVDFGYRGQWAVILHNFSNRLFQIKHQDRVTQFIIQKCELPILIPIPMEELLAIPSSRGAGALGSTDGVDPEKAQELISGGKSQDEIFRMK